MTQHARVSINQWLITAAVGLFGIWGGYSVLQYRVSAVETTQSQWVSDYKIVNEKTDTRLESDRKERAANERSILCINNKLTNIEADVKEVKELLKK